MFSWTLSLTMIIKEINIDFDVDVDGINNSNIEYEHDNYYDVGDININIDSHVDDDNVGIDSDYNTRNDDLPGTSMLKLLSM